YLEAEECLKACISKWLSRADDVDANGGANWSTLCDAIERIGETGAHFIRGQHGLIPSQPVEQINYQGHSEPSQIAGSDDGTQLRQRPSAAPSNESSGTEGADKPPPPSNPSSSGKTSNANGLYLVFLLLLSGDIELNPGPGDPRDILRANSYALIRAISNNLAQVAVKLNAKGLIPQQAVEDTSIVACSDDKKAAQLVGVLRVQLHSCNDPQRYLADVCNVLKDLGDETLAKHAIDILSELVTQQG
uniref:Uncharacterized protein n=1 Tax=Amphimedon queenslandica TaxID=400682 RepID=A0A1X7TMS5_AMPQE